ncbi:calponin homology domain-containing protein [Dipodascopsis tothii]|uniref:calponin homology domain-containing protein n=1 Tax=Dipodascopsis tothii TaxID=44089 RepID=UPI0034CDD5B7
MSSAGTPAWIATQHKAFIRWTNSHLEARNIDPVKSLKTDFCDGVKLIQLLEIIGNESLGRYVVRPKLRVQKAENMNTALDFIRRRGIQLYNIGAEDIMDGNVKLILGLLWTLILRFTIDEINAEGFTAKEGLLLWCQRKTALYDDVNIVDFTSSWNNGLAFCALLDRHRPDLIDYDTLDKTDHKGNVALALKIASEHVGIPQLLDVEDVCVPKPDERSIMTYVAYWFHAFSAMDKIETAGRRVEKFVEVITSAYDMETSYEKRIKALIDAIKRQIQQWESTEFSGTYLDAKEKRQTFFAYKAGAKRNWTAEKTDIASMLGNIKTKLATYHLRDYNPPEGLRLVDLDAYWKQLLAAEGIQSKRINDAIRDIKLRLRRTFADTANDLSEKLSSLSLTVASLDGELHEQLDRVKNAEKHLETSRNLVDLLKKLEEDCNEANIEENDYTVFSYDDLNYEYGLTRDVLTKKLAFIENQIVARSMTNLTPIQLEEFESVFRHFDRGESNSLQEPEFSAALASLGLVFSGDEMHDIFDEVREGNSAVSFEQFIHFMVDMTEDQNTAEQVFQSFMEIADGKPYLTEIDLRQSLVSETMIDELSKIMPRAADSDGLDYVKYMEKLCLNE